MEITFQNYFVMKTLKTLLVAFAALTFTLQSNAQFCSNFGEGDFVDLCVEQMGAGTTGGMMSNTLDIYDATTGGAGADGTPDVQVTMEAVVCAATDACGQSSGNIGACIGGMGALGTTSDFAADFNSNNTGPGGETTCENAGGYVCVTIDFLNGFSSTAMGFDLAQTSNNGSSEGYEGSFGYVTAGTDANGNPLTLPAVTIGDFCNYTNTEYLAGTSVSTFLGVTGPGTYQTDELNAIPNVCGTTTSDNGEDTGSGSGGTNGTGAAAANANLGLNPTDIITQVKHIYFYTSTPSTDCDGDGLTAANSNPSGSWSDVDFCFEPACGYTLAEGDVTITESCGTYTIEFVNLSAEGAASPVTTEAYNILIDGTAIASGVTGDALAATDITANITPGTPFTLTIENAADMTCSTDLMLTPPPSNPPVAPVFVPCTTGTTGVGGN